MNLAINPSPIAIEGSSMVLSDSVEMSKIGKVSTGVGIRDFKV
jgi:hypothetical protein